MNIRRYWQVCALFLFSVAMTTVEAKKRCQEADTTSDKCVITKDGREKKSKKQAAPQWKNGPPKDSQIIVREGGSETLSCAVKGSPYPKFSWIINGQVLNSTKSKKFRQKKNRLHLESLQLVDSADYTCLAKNPLGSLNFTYSIKVLENMPLKDIEVEKRPENQTAHIGDTVIFMCRSRDWPKPRVHWTRQTLGSSLLEIVENASNEEDVLVLHSVNKTDAGRYNCMIANDYVRKEFTATLTVIAEGESLPFEPPCSLHVRREVLVDQLHGCKSAVPVEIRYCMGSCGRSYYIPRLITSETSKKKSPLDPSVEQTCKCCVGVVNGLRIVELDCPLGNKKRGFYTLLSECQCRTCSVTGEDVPKTKT